MIEDRNIKPGTKLVAKYKGKDYTAEVVKTEDGVVYRLADEQVFKSLSSAGSAVMGGSACNGWRFWSIAEAASPKVKTSKARAKRTQPRSPAAQTAEPAPGGDAELD